MRVVLTTQAKEDMLALALLDKQAYQRLHHWLSDPIQRLSDECLSIRLCINIGLDLFSRHLSEVHRIVYTYQGDEVIVLQCRFHF